jgi:AcrR family transcriptional regulator
VGVTAPSIYLHFSDKNELVFEVCRQEFEALHQHLAAALEGLDEPLDRMRAMGRAYIAFGERNPETYRVLFMHKADAGPPSEDLPDMLAKSGFGLLVAEVQRAVDDGIMAGDVQLLAVQLWTAVHGVTSLLISHPNFPWPDVERLKEEVLETLLSGLTAQH